MSQSIAGGGDGGGERGKHLARSLDHHTQGLKVPFKNRRERERAIPLCGSELGSTEPPCSTEPCNVEARRMHFFHGQSNLETISMGTL